MYLSLQFIRSLGFQPDLIIDCGVAYGTKELYKVYPDSEYLLIEPLEIFNTHLEKYLSKENFNLLNVCVSSSVGQTKFYVRSKTSTSSINEGSSKKEIIIVNTNKLDNILNQYYPKKNNILLKIDVEGHELEVLKGSMNSLSKVKIIFAEVTFFNKLKGSAKYTDILNFLLEHNYVLTDIINIRNAKESKSLSQADFVFINKDYYSLLGI